MVMWFLFISLQKINIFTTPTHHRCSCEGTSRPGDSSREQMSGGQALHFGFSPVPYSAVQLVSPKSAAALGFILKYLKFINKSSIQLAAWVLALPFTWQTEEKQAVPIKSLNIRSLRMDCGTATKANDALSINT